MDWASRRRFIIFALVAAVALAFLAVVGIATLYKTPSCSDGKQNQGEAGVDCGGPCPYLCASEVSAAKVLFTRLVSNEAGRTDVIASVENPNGGAAAKAVPYVLELYGVAGNTLVRHVNGTIDLPPAATVPVFVPGVSQGGQEVTSAFLTIGADAPKWYKTARDPRVLPVVTNTTLGGTVAAPRIDAVLSNASVMPMNDVRAIVLVHSASHEDGDASGDVIAASQTVVPLVPAQGQATATFTWNGAFPETPATIEVVPIIPLP